VHFVQLRRLDASLLVGLYAKDLYGGKGYFFELGGQKRASTLRYLEEVQRICDRAAIDEVAAHGGTANGTIRGTAP
jgi:hypothetical protein